MRHTLLSVFIVLGLLGCQEKPKPAPKKPTPAAVVQDPAALEKARIQAAQKRVTEVLEELKVKHADLAALNPIINEIPVPHPQASGSAPAPSGSESGEYLYEIVSSRGIVYTNKNVDYIFMGSLFIGSGQSVQNLTSRPAVQDALAKMQQAQSDVSGSDVFQSIWLQDGLSYKYGTGENRIVVFEDPDCPSCQKLHHNLETFGAKLNLDIKVIPYVLTSKHPEGVARAKALFCAPDPAASWKAWMLEASGKDVASTWATFSKTHNLSVTNCEKAAFVDSWQDVGQQLGLSATPSIMFASGVLAEGALSEDEFTEALAMGRQAQQGAASLQPAPAQATTPVVQTTTTVTTAPAAGTPVEKCGPSDTKCTK